MIAYTVYPYEEQTSRFYFTAPTSWSTTHFWSTAARDGRTDGRTHPWIGDHGDDGDDDDDDDDENDDAVDARETSRETRTDGDDRHGTEKQDDDIKNYSRNVDDDSSVVG